MSNGDMTVGAFLLEADRDHLQAVEAEAGLAAVRTALSAQAAAIPWEAARAEIDRVVRSALDVKLDDVLVSAWVRSALLVRYLDSSKYAPDQAILAHLSEHTIKTTLKPSIDVYVGDVLVKAVPLEAQLSLALKGFVLTIKGGRVLQIATGTCKATGKVTLAGVPLAEKTLESFSFPGVIHFPDGRPIVTRAA